MVPLSEAQPWLERLCEKPPQPMGQAAITLALVGLGCHLSMVGLALWSAGHFTLGLDHFAGFVFMFWLGVAVFAIVALICESQRRTLAAIGLLICGIGILLLFMS